jgi:peptidoglycan/xylan/chitin deacetylase (PgdA/CDA1 family)
MRALARSRTSVVPLADVRQVPDSLAITFDDGFRNFYELAFPVLSQFRFPATVFVVSRYCGKQNNWPSQPARGIPVLDLLRWSELQELSRNGVTLGAHSLSHPRLTLLPESQAEAELRDSKAEIEDRTGQAVDTFAYPYGDSNRAVRKLAQRYFGIACGTELQAVSQASDWLDLPRIDAYYFQHRLFFDHLATVYGETYLTARRCLRNLKRVFNECSTKPISSPG